MTKREKLFVILMEEAGEVLQALHKNEDPIDEVNDLLAVAEMLELGGFPEKEIHDNKDLKEALFSLHQYTAKALRFGEMNHNPYDGTFPYEEVVKAYESINQYFKGGDGKAKAAKMKKVEASLRL